MFFALEVQPIPPSQIVNAVNKTGESAVEIGKSVSEPFAVYIVIAAGIVIVTGLILIALGFTKKILGAGISMLFGTMVMLLLTNQSVEVVGILKGTVAKFIGYIKEVQPK